MSSRGERPEVWANGLDPSTALTVGEAARLAGVSEATVRKRIQSGRLLHEVGRRGGREVQLVRLVDLADVYPQLAGREPTPRGDPAPEREPALGEERAAGPGAGTGAGPAAGPTAGPGAGPGAGLGAGLGAGPAAEPGAGAAAVPGDGHGGAARRHAFEVRLASLQVGNDGLGAQVRELQVQRADLKAQCTDLRTRLSSVERERQAGTAGLLLAQRRLLELEVAGPIVQLGPVWWRRSRTWGLGVVLLLLGGTLGLEIHGSRTARAAAREDASQLEGRLAHLARDLDAVQESGTRALGQWASAREAWAAERQNLEQRATAGEGREADLTAHLQAAREAGQQDRRLLQESLAEARALTDSVREELTREREESRAERTRSAELFGQRTRSAELFAERERVAAAERAAERAATERALAELGRRAQASAEAAETLAGELAQRRIEEQQRTALLLEEIQRLGARLPALPPTGEERVPERDDLADDLADERARRWLFGLHLPGMLQTPGEGGR